MDARSTEDGMIFLGIAMILLGIAGLHRMHQLSKMFVRFDDSTLQALRGGRISLILTLTTGIILVAAGVM